jgi:arylsulfatase A-like enzyme
MTKRGRQDVLVNLADFLPTLADLTGARLPADYEINGESLAPFLFTEKPAHREWIYGYQGAKQLIRGANLLRDGSGKWWDVSAAPDDLISFPPIKGWKTVGEPHRSERRQLEAILPRFNNHDTEPNKPGVEVPDAPKAKGGSRKTLR